MNTNDPCRETGNHHHWWNNAVQHQVETGGWLPHDTTAYSTGFGDDHPSRAGNQKATPEFVPFLNLANNRRQAG